MKLNIAPIKSKGKVKRINEIPDPKIAINSLFAYRLPKVKEAANNIDIGRAKDMHLGRYKNDT